LKKFVSDTIDLRIRFLRLTLMHVHANIQGNTIRD